MTIRNLDRMFRPRSVAVIGASPRADSVGNRVLRNIIDGGFKGPIYPVNPKHAAIEGLAAARGVADLPDAPDLAVIATPAPTVPGLIAELGARGTRAAVVLTAGLSAPAPDGKGSLSQAMLDAARPHLMRILGPNCVGLLLPGCALNASFAHTDALKGSLAFVSQSGGMCTAVLDWAKSRGLGFSHFISLGNAADVDFGDVIDYLALDPAAKAILLYIESIADARKFMTATRAAARGKPVVAIKAGRVAEGARAAASHTGALAGADNVYDAALARAGAVRVYDVEELFDAVETLSRTGPATGDRMAIVTNGGGPGVMATDALVLGGGRVAEISKDTLAALDAVLPANWSRGNPVDIIGDATADRYTRATDILVKDPGVDAILFLHVPVAMIDSAALARDVAGSLTRSGRGIYASWVGGDAVAEARRIFEAAGIPCFDTPERAVRGFLHRVRHQRARTQLMETPPAVTGDGAPDRAKAAEVLRSALHDGRDMLSEAEGKAVLAAYGIPVVPTRVAASPDEAAAIAGQLGLPAAVKILSPQISHKSDVGGVALGLESTDGVRQAAAAMANRVARQRPDAELTGFTVQPMVHRPGAHEIIVGAATDPTFGPVILFGHGGVQVEAVADRAVALPPLNALLAREMIGRTRIARLLAGYRDRPPADMESLIRALVRLSGLVADFAEIAEIDVNPLLVDQDGVVALDARIRVSPAAGPPEARMAVRPYPADLEERIDLLGRSVLLRPIRPEDEPQHAAFLARVAPEDLYLRFFGYPRLTHENLARLTQIDYDREMALIATAQNVDGEPETLGVVRALCDPDNEAAEFAILVRSDMKGRGLGRILMRKLIDYLRGHGAARVRGLVLKRNRAMRGLTEGLGFTVHPTGDQETVEVELRLN